MSDANKEWFWTLPVSQPVRSGRTVLPVSTLTEYIFTTAMYYKQTCILLSVYFPVNRSLMVLVNQMKRCSFPQTLCMFFEESPTYFHVCAHTPARPLITLTFTHTHTQSEIIVLPCRWVKDSVHRSELAVDEKICSGGGGLSQMSQCTSRCEWVN